MYLTRQDHLGQPRWALDGEWLPTSLGLKFLLELPRKELVDCLKTIPSDGQAEGSLLAPVEADHEVWGSGVTYARSRDAREAETEVKDIYDRVYEADRPEIFFKAIGWRSVGHGAPIRIRRDTSWNVPEPELTLVINRHAEIIGYCVGNDVSSRDIEGQNPLYLPQAKTYDGSCAIGPGIRIVQADDIRNVAIQIEILRKGEIVFKGETRTSEMKREFEELVSYLTTETTFPHGGFLMTGTGIVPPDDFTLACDDLVKIAIDGLTLENRVTS